MNDSISVKKENGNGNGKSNGTTSTGKISDQQYIIDLKTLHSDMLVFHQNMPKIQRKNLVLFSLLILLIISIVGLVIWFFMDNKNLKLIEIRIAAARYELIKPSAEYELMLAETKLMEGGLRTKLVMYGEEYPKERRMTENELQRYTTCIYIGKVLDRVDDVLFRANTASESLFNKTAKSKVNAVGLNQLMERTFKWVNENILLKFGNVDIWDVFHNSEASVKYWIFNQKFLEFKLNRSMKPIELAWAYNAGADAVLKAIVSGQPDLYLPQETIAHGKKVMFYYTNYLQRNYQVWWEEQYMKEFQTNKEVTD